MKTKIVISTAIEPEQVYEISHDGNNYDLIRKFISYAVGDGISFVNYPMRIAVRIEELE